MKASHRRYPIGVGGLVLATSLWCSLALAQPLEGHAALIVDAPTRSIFNEGWASAKVGDLVGLDAATTKLRAHAPDTPLLVYLQFERMRQSIDEVDVDTVTRFLATHRDWSFADRLERTWLRSLARRGAVATVDAYLDQTGQQATDTTLRCWLAHHRVRTPPSTDSPAHATLLKEIESLWEVPRSQHDACDRAFAWWRSQGMPSEAVAWSRFLMAIKNGERSLAGYLKRYLDADLRIWADRWLMMQRNPHRGLSDARRWPDGELARSLVEWGLIQLARRDWSRAAGHWQNLVSRFDWAALSTRTIMREIALFQAVALDDRAIERIDALPEVAQDGQIWAWRARVAMAHGRWAEVLTSIQRMPARDQIDDRWRYWRGRA
jgi:soluble lytic murein transglycosylase